MDWLVALINYNILTFNGLLLYRVQLEFEFEGGTHIYLGAEAHFPTKFVDDAFGNDQSESNSIHISLLSVFYKSKQLEQFCLVLLLDSHARVFYFNFEKFIIILDNC